MLFLCFHKAKDSWEMDLKEKLDLSAEVKSKGNQYFKVQLLVLTQASKWFIYLFLDLRFIKIYSVPSSGRAVLPGSHPVPAHHFLARDRVWYRRHATEEDTRLYSDFPP